MLWLFKPSGPLPQGSRSVMQLAHIAAELNNRSRSETEEKLFHKVPFHGTDGTEGGSMVSNQETRSAVKAVSCLCTSAVLCLLVILSVGTRPL